ncbi:ABC transporter permease [Azospirillum halopraeferens]|uniref:ABC transporter permease n=1 Tax=Azospirillum halopraeferens TaxID=34010 RepID=UPI000413C4F8|nr:ABC transporter permease [Azospirillum halopraeferens]
MAGILRPLAGRAVQALTVALLVGLVSFALMHALPGDPAMRIAASRYGPDLMTAEAAERVRAELGLDRPMPVQLAEWVGRLATFDLGRSLVTGAPVAEELEIQLGASLWLAGAALALSMALGLPAGLLAGMRAGRLPDHLALAAAVLLRALPVFVTGLVLIIVFAVWLGWLPAAGFGGWRDLLLPGLTLAFGLAALSSRVTRDATAAVLAAPYVAFARTKGLPERLVVLRHGVRNAAIPVVAVLGLQLVYLVEGMVVVESLFAYPGIGHALVHAIIARDVPMVQGTALAMGLTFVLVNAVVDLLCAALDPRQVAR